MASQAIGSLFVSLGLDTATFSAGVKQAQGRIEAFANGLNKRLGRIGDLPGVAKLQAGLAAVGVSAGAALGAATGAAAVGLGYMSMSAITAAKELQNLSSLAGSTPEEFQKIAYAAEQVGISQEKMSDILKDVNDRVGDFIATGGGPMKDFFERIAPQVGVTAEQFRKLSGPQALQLYVDSLEKANVNQQDFTFFMEAMASDSTALLPILRNGGKAAQEYGDRLVALGGVMSNETVAKLAGMKTALNEVMIVMRSVGTTLGAAFAPVLQSLAQAFVSLMTQGSGLRAMLDGVASIVGRVADLFAALVNIIGSVVGAVWNIVSAFASWINEMTGVGDALSWLMDVTILGFADAIIWISDLITVTGGLGGALAAVADIAAEVWDRMKQGVQSLYYIFDAAAAGIASAFIGSFARILTGFASLTTSIANGWNTLMGSLGIESNATGLGEGLAASLTETASSLAQISKDGFATGADLLVDAARPLESVAAINDKIAESGKAAAAAMGGSGGGLASAVDDAGKKGGGAAAKLSDLQKVMQKLREEADKLRATMGMSDLQAQIWELQNEAGVAADSANGKQIADLATQVDKMKELKDATEEWRDTIGSAFSDFITKGGSFKEVLGEIIGKLAEMLASSAFNQLWGAAGGNGVVSGILSGLGIGGNANGTRDWRGGLTRVNERGGEIMNLPKGTQIIPNDISKRMADASGRQSSVNVLVTPSPYFDAVVDQRATNITKQGLAQAQRQQPDSLRQYSADPRRRS
jgi:hypothetical protein